MWGRIAVGNRRMGHKRTSNPAVAVVVAAEPDASSFHGTIGCRSWTGQLALWRSADWLPSVLTGVFIVIIT